MRVFPAYARPIAGLIARGVKPAAVGVLLSERWNYFQTAPRVCIRPDEWERRRWEFGFLRNQHVVAILGDGAEHWQFAQLLVELMDIGPRLLWACMAGGEWLFKGDDPQAVHSYAIESLRGPPTVIEDGEVVRRWENDGWKGPTFHDSLGARANYQAARKRALDAEMRVMKRAEEKSGNVVQWYNEEQAELAFVERLFSDPYAVLEDEAAA